jgi:hypothetical protein
MMATPQELLGDIRDRLHDLPERLASVLTRGQATKLKDPQGEQQKPLGKWQAAEGLLGSASSFSPVLGKLGGLMGDIRKFGDSLEQFKTAWTPQKQQPLPPMPKPETPKLSPMMARLQPEALNRLNPQEPIDGGRTELKTPIKPQGIGTGITQGGQQGVNQLPAKLEKVADKIDDLIEALDKNAPDDTERAETEPQKKEKKEKAEPRQMDFVRDVPKIRQGGGMPHSIPQNVPSSKDKEGSGIPWGELAIGAARLFFHV